MTDEAIEKISKKVGDKLHANLEPDSVSTKIAKDIAHKDAHAAIDDLRQMSKNMAHETRYHPIRTATATGKLVASKGTNAHAYNPLGKMALKAAEKPVDRTPIAHREIDRLQRLGARIIGYANVSRPDGSRINIQKFRNLDGTITEVHYGNDYFKTRHYYPEPQESQQDPFAPPPDDYQPLHQNINKPKTPNADNSARIAELKKEILKLGKVKAYLRKNKKRYGEAKAKRVLDEIKGMAFKYDEELHMLENGG